MEHKGWHERGYLPHFDAAGTFQHVVFRLHGSLPGDLLDALRTSDPAEDQRQAAIDDMLDRSLGPTWLADPENARIVAQALTHFDGERYRLLAWCVMPNHVHVLVQQQEGWPLGAVVKSWKTFSARAINKRLGRNGVFWASDYFDRYMRDPDQMEAARFYIEANPVSAGLCQTSSNWRWSSATERGPPGPQAPITPTADLEVRAPFLSNPPR
ncbi:transposase [Brevundimonas sp.]|uniref:REP-associated tyrosine transposase n=1 Tax=Brevundimonas sp. TaxID=1871086 RepID=UPI00257C18C4|nr:transposase [Brevundimonas sp.]